MGRKQAAFADSQARALSQHGDTDFHIVEVLCSDCYVFCKLQRKPHLPVLGVSMQGIHRAAHPLILPNLISTDLLIPLSLPACPRLE